MTINRHGSAQIEFPNDCEVLITREFSAPAELVFDALTKPEHVTVWFSGLGEPLESCTIDFRVGGDYHFAWREDDIVCSFRGTYLEIERLTRIVDTWVFEGRPEADAVETTSLREEGGVTVLQNRLTFKDQESRDAHMWLQPEGVQDSNYREGVQDSFDRLDDHLASLL
jgi:uncharacterized protein YndB with AHSA1/START domain